MNTDLPGDEFPDEGQRSPASVSWQIGIAPTPRNFPEHSSDDVEAMLMQTASLADVSVFIYQWSQVDLVDVAEIMVERSRDADLVSMIGLSPTTLDEQRGEIDAPLPSNLFEVVLSFIADPSFQQPWIQDDFIETSESLAELHPPYLCLATEINLLELQNSQEAEYFIDTYKEAYAAVKEISPETKVFVSFQYEFIRVLDNLEPGRLAEHRELIDAFRPELDVLAITSYPSPFYDRPDLLPGNYYTYLQNYRKGDEEIVVMEIGWPSEAGGSQSEQAVFIERLPGLMSDLSPSIVAWSLLHDVDLGSLDANLSTTGLLTKSGESKSALQSWEDLETQGSD